jgi:outer membrane protein assembly factor BamD (BamD/ComL family)
MNDRICSTLLTLSLLLLLPALPLHAEDAADATKRIVEAYDNSRFEEAAKLAQAFIQSFPQSPNLSSAYLLLARSQYNLSQWTPAITAYRKLQTLSKEKDVLEEASYYILQSLVAQGNASPEKSAERKKNLSEALTLIAAFPKEFPDSKSLAEIRLLQARIHIQEGAFAEASQDLDAARTADKEKELAEDIDYLQGYAEAQRARQLLADFKKADGEAALARAGQIYARIANGTNPALALEANLQLASLDLAAGRIPEGITRLRAIPGKEELISLLEAKLAPLRAEITGQGTPSPEKLRRVQKAQQKIEEVRNRPDLSGQALLQLGQSYLQTRGYDEGRIVFRQVARFGSPDLVPTAEQQIILTYALQGRTSDADRLVAEYQKKYPDQKGVAGLVDYLVGFALLEEGKYEDSIKRLKAAQGKGVDPRYADEIPRFIASAYQKNGQGAEAIKYYESFLSDVKAGKIKVSDESKEQTQLAYASTLISEKKFPEGVTQFTQLSTSATTPSIREDASLRLAYALRSSKKLSEAAAAFAKFATDYPKSSNLGNALLIRGDTLLEDKKPEEAMAAWKTTATQLTGAPAGLDAYERIWRFYAKDKKKDLMLAAQEDQFRAYPKDPRNIGAYLARGASFADEKDESQAIQAYRRAFELFKELFPDPKVSPPPVAISDLAYSALEKSSDLELASAKALGNYASLADDGKKKWKDSIQRSIDFLRQSILGISTAKVSPVLSKLVSLSLYRFQSGEAPVEECLQPFRDLAGEASAQPGLVAQILFAQASVPFEAGQTTLALRLYQEAYKQSLATKVSLDWRDLQRFANALLAAGQGEEARPVFERIRKEFPAKVGTKDPRQHAQAAALFGLGQIDFQANRKAEAEKYFAELTRDYPWSDKVQEAYYLRAQALAEAGKYDGTKKDPAAFELWIGIIESGTATNEMKAKSMLAFGQALESLAAKKLSSPQLEQAVGKPPLDPLDLAVSYYQKIDLYYDNLPELSGQGLLRAAKIRRAQQKNDDARKIVTSLLCKYPTSSVTSEASELLQSLPAASAAPAP